MIKVGDIVKWVEEFGFVAWYGEVVRVNKNTFTIRNETTSKLERVPKALVYWS